jgi:translation initiation factor 2B subunit (eIF-2B alpha/beta/delta family)
MNGEERLKEIANDNLSGASEILHNARDCFLSYSQEIQSDSNEAYYELMAGFGLKLVSAQPSMAPVFNYVNEVLLYLEDSLDDSLDVAQLKKETNTISEGYISHSQNAITKIQKQIFNLTENGSVIMTHSYSSTIIRSLINAKDSGKDFAVIVPESRPGFEGRKTGRMLSENGIKTTLIADMAAFSFLNDVDMVLVGCDSLSKAGVVNKIGTLGLAMAAKSFERSFYAAGESSKFLPSIYKSKPDIDNMDPDEIMKDSGSMEIKNFYFDTTPYHHITGIITEDGILAPSQIVKLLGGMRVSQKLLR